MFWKRKTVRRKGRPAREPGEGGLWRRVRQEVPAATLLMGIAFALGAAWVLQVGGEAMPYRVGQTLDQDVRARVRFSFTDHAATQRLREEAERDAPNVFVFNEALVRDIRRELNQLLAIAKAHRESYEKFAAEASKAGWQIDEEGFAALQQFLTEEGAAHFRRAVEELERSLVHQRLVRKVARTPPSAILRQPDGQERHVDFEVLEYVSDEQTVRKVANYSVWGFPGPLRAAVAEMVVRKIRPSDDPATFEPVYRYDEEATRKLIQQRVAAVQPVVVTHEAGETLIRAWEAAEGGVVKPRILREEDLFLLNLEHQAYLKALEREPSLRRQRLLHQIGVLVYAAVLTAGLGVYAYRYQRRVLTNWMRALGLAGLLIAMLLVSRVFVLRGVHEVVIGAVVFVAAVLTIAYDQRFALGVTGVAVLLAATLFADMSVQQGARRIVPMVATSGVLIFLLDEIRSRSKLIGVGAVAAAMALATIMAGEVIERQTLSYALRVALWSAAAVIISVSVVQSLLPLIERVFNVATSMTLLEWRDASKPLLRRLAQEAPGTYNHSLILCNLAEAAADAIGANGLLAGTGALYHDIGKILKPEYFTENQEARINRHEKLAPTLSLMIIRGHVKDGLELARQYGLPRVLHPFIAEHHGTTVVRYFHHRAAEQQKAMNRPEIPEHEFRYPGPRPRSKETAILMICDGVEGAVRALPEPTPLRIEATVHQVVQDRLNDGQFSECDITLRELRLVEESIVRSLCRFYHGRVTYPRSEKPAAGAGEGRPPGEAPWRAREAEEAAAASASRSMRSA